MQDQEQAQSLADGALWEFRQQLLDELSDAELNGVVFAKTLIAFAAQGDAPLHWATTAAQSTWQGGPESAVACLDTLDHVDANANQATLLECWLDELSEIARTGQAVSA